METCQHFSSKGTPRTPTTFRLPPLHSQRNNCICCRGRRNFFRFLQPQVKNIKNPVVRASLFGDIKVTCQHIQMPQSLCFRTDMILLVIHVLISGLTYGQHLHMIIMRRSRSYMIFHVFFVK